MLNKESLHHLKSNRCRIEVSNCITSLFASKFVNNNTELLLLQSDEVILFLINLQIVWFIKGQNFSNKFSFLEPDKDIDFTITEDEEKQKLFIFQ